MIPINKTYIPLIIIFFIFGVVLGYIAHKPATIEKPVYINTTVEKVVEKVVQVTATPTSTATAIATTVETPAISDFTVRNYDPSTDVPKWTMTIGNYVIDPNALSARIGDPVLIQIKDDFLQNRLAIIINASYQTPPMGTGGALMVTFNKKGMYSIKVIIPSGDPVILPKDYAQGTISVN